MSNLLVIGLVGYAGAGKDTAAARLVENHGFVQLSFARKLKEIISMVFDVPLNYFEDRDLKNVDHPNLHVSTIDQKFGKGLNFSWFLIPVLADLYDKRASEIESLGWHNIAASFFRCLLPVAGCSPRRAAQLIGTEGFRNSLSETTWLDYVIRQVKDQTAVNQSVVISDVRFRDEMDAIKSVCGSILAIRRDLIESHNHASEHFIGTMIGECDAAVFNNDSIDLLSLRIDEVLASIRKSNTGWTDPFPFPFAAIRECAIQHCMLSYVQSKLWSGMTQWFVYDDKVLLGDLLKIVSSDTGIAVKRVVGGWVAKLDR